MLDGHAEGLNLTQIQDMRYWANEADRPDWTPVNASQRTLKFLQAYFAA